MTRPPQARMTRRGRGAPHRIDPAWPTLAFAAAIAVSPEFEFLGIPKVRLTDLLVPVLLLIFTGAMATGRPLWRVPALPLVHLAALVTAWDVAVLLSLGNASHLALGVAYLGKRLIYFLIFYMGMAAVSSLRAWKDILRLFVLTAPLLNLAVLYDLAGGHYRASGLTPGQETSTAMFIVVVLGMVFGVWPAVRHPAEKLALALAAGTGVAALLATGSRAGVLCAAVVGLVLLWRQRTSLLAFSFLVVGVATAAWLGMPEPLRERYERFPVETRDTWRGLVEDPSMMPSVGSSSVAARVLVARHVLTEVIPRSPLFGHGAGSWRLGAIDNFYLLEWVYHGLLGLGLMLLLFYRLYRLLAEARDTAEDPLQEGLAAGMVAVMAALAVGGFTAETFYLVRPMEAFMLLCGLTLGRGRLRQDQEP